jgi:hypothetical protein
MRCLALTASTLLQLVVFVLSTGAETAAAAAAAAAATQRQPCVPLRNAARPGTCMPLTGLGVVGYGCVAGGRSQCWH